MAKSLTKEDYRTLTGVQKTAIMMMSMDEQNASKIFAMMDDEEIKEISDECFWRGHGNI